MKTSSPAAWLLAAVLCVGCSSTKLVKEPVFTSTDGKVEVALWRTLESGEPVAQGYTHPTTISDVRLAHILASLTYQDEQTKRAVIRTLQAYDLAEGMSDAFEKATPADAVVAVAKSADKRIKVFTEHRVTALRSYFDRDELIIEFFDIEEPIERDHKNSEFSYRIPERVPDKKTRQRLVPSDSITLYGKRGFAATWRDDTFRKPLDLVGGTVRRRTILMEAEPEDQAPAPAPIQVPTGVRDAQIEALDMLEDEREAGAITEGDFQRRRRMVLEGRLEEAGFGSAP